MFDVSPPGRLPSTRGDRANHDRVRCSCRRAAVPAALRGAVGWPDPRHSTTCAMVGWAPLWSRSRCGAPQACRARSPWHPEEPRLGRWWWAYLIGFVLTTGARHELRSSAIPPASRRSPRSPSFSPSRFARVRCVGRYSRSTQRVRARRRAEPQLRPRPDPHQRSLIAESPIGNPSRFVESTIAIRRFAIEGSESGIRIPD